MDVVNWRAAFGHLCDFMQSEALPLLFNYILNIICLLVMMTIKIEQR